MRENLLQRASCIFMKWVTSGQSIWRHWRRAIGTAQQGGMCDKQVEWCREMVSEKFQEAFRCALVGDPPAKVPPITLQRKLEAGMVRDGASSTKSVSSPQIQPG